jgi:hypothetical protein
VALVPQDVALVNDTLAANIAFARPAASEAEVGAAAEAHVEADPAPEPTTAEGAGQELPADGSPTEPAAQTEPSKVTGAAATDPDSADHSDEATTAPEDDAAVRNERTASPNGRANKPVTPAEPEDDKLF